MKSIIIVLLFALNLFAQLNGKASKVKDGDTFNFINSDVELTIRLNGIDAPEKKQKYGIAAKEFLADLIMGKNIKVQIVDTDHYGRSIANVFIGDLNVNRLLLLTGLAYHYKEYDKTPDYINAEETAKRLKLGFWADPDMIAPWDFRKISKADSDIEESQEELLDIASPDEVQKTKTPEKTVKKDTPKKTTKVQCSALTKKGKRCSRMTDSPNGLCWQHGGN